MSHARHDFCEKTNALDTTKYCIEGVWCLYDRWRKKMIG